MTTSAPDARGWHNIEGEPTAAAIRALCPAQRIEKLSITKARLLTVELTKQFHLFHSVGWMWLWCDVTRAAMRHVVRVPGLQVLDVLNIKSPGKLEGFDAASSLRTVRANHYLKEEDVLAITRCRTLKRPGYCGGPLG